MNEAKSEFYIEDVKKLYEAFTSSCDYIEQHTEEGCSKCPNQNICFGMQGNLFAESLSRIKNSIS